MRARRPQLLDIACQPIRPGDTVKVATGDWANGIAKWMADTEGSVVALGRTRVTVHFDGQDRSHTIAPNFLMVSEPKT